MFGEIRRENVVIESITGGKIERALEAARKACDGITKVNCWISGKTKRWQNTWTIQVGDILVKDLSNQSCYWYLRGLREGVRLKKYDK